MGERYRTFDDFFPYYLRQHSKPLCRALHYAGTLLAIAALIAFAITGQGIYLLAAPLLGYGFAWFAHALVEKNRPATFTYPLWSLAGDFRMLALFLTGRLAPQLARARDPGARTPLAGC